MRILFGTAEFAPLARSGGLGDAIAGLAQALVRQGAAVTVVLPRYRKVFDLGEALADRPYLFRYMHDGVEVLLVDDPDSFDREGIYGPKPGEGYDDNWKRWARFSTAIIDVAGSGDYDLLNLHDAHTALAATRSEIPTAFTIHNAAYPILGDLEEVGEMLGLPPSMAAPLGELEWFGEANYMKAGLVFADQVTTVSPGFAAQMAHDTSVTGGLDGVIRDLDQPPVGIMNGIDIKSFNPATDDSLPLAYDSESWSRRTENRRALASATGIDPTGIMFGTVGRVTGQKGFELMDPVIGELVAEGYRLIVVGNGDQDELVDEWVDSHPTAVAHLPFDEKLARLTWAGADSYIMPSKFEPGGLGNIYAMRYGCPPVVRFTGGLADTVVDVDEDPTNGNGLGFRPYETESFAKTVRRAMRLIRHHPETWEQMAIRGMEGDWSWDRAAVDYMETYRTMLAAAKA
jgi:starch synthase